MTAPLRMEFDVDCSAEHAFTVWTSGIGTWWPADHTVTGRADLDIVLQGGVGGRIYERTPDGTEHDWGEVTAWSPPTRRRSSGATRTRPAGRPSCRTSRQRLPPP